MRPDTAQCRSRSRRRRTNVSGLLLLLFHDLSVPLLDYCRLLIFLSVLTNTLGHVLSLKPIHRVIYLISSLCAQWLSILGHQTFAKISSTLQLTDNVKLSQVASTTNRDTTIEEINNKSYNKNQQGIASLRLVIKIPTYGIVYGTLFVFSGSRKTPPQ